MIIGSRSTEREFKLWPKQRTWQIKIKMVHEMKGMGERMMVPGLLKGEKINRDSVESMRRDWAMLLIIINFENGTFASCLPA